MSTTATAICPFCQHESTAPAQLSGLQAQCPNCANLFTFTPVEPTAAFSGAETLDDAQPLVLRIVRRRVMHIQCPNCECDLRLNHTKWVRLRKAHLKRLKRRKRKALMKKVRTQAAAGMLLTETPEITAPAEPALPHSEIPPAVAKRQVPVAAGVQPPPESSIVARRRRRAAEKTHERQRSVALEWLVPVVILLISGAIFCTPFSLAAPLVLPLAGAGALCALIILIAAARRHEFVVRSAATCAYGAVVLLLLLFAPRFFGGNYQSFRQRAPSADFVQVIPKRGQSATNIPKDSDWVDASRYALERNHVLVEIMAATIGNAEIREPGGKLRMSSEPYLVISLRRRRAADGEEFAAGIQGRPDVRESELKMVLTDNQGRNYARQEVDLAWNNSGLARASTVFPVSTTDDMIAFAPPADDVEFLRLEVTSPQLGSGPVRFTIPKSMIVRPRR